MKRHTFTDMEYSNRRRKTKWEEFLNAMDQMIPWSHWVDIILLEKEVVLPEGLKPCSAYLAVGERPEIREDEHLSQIEFRINQWPSSLKMKVTSGINWDKTAYRGNGKNMNRFQFLFSSANVLMCIRAGRKQDFITCMG